MPRYFNFNYNFFVQNRQEGVILLDAVLCIMISLLCWASMVHIYGACIDGLHRASDRLHALACARTCIQRNAPGSDSCAQHCIIKHEIVRQEGIAWHMVTVTQKQSTVHLMRVEKFH